MFRRRSRRRHMQELQQQQAQWEQELERLFTCMSDPSSASCSARLLTQQQQQLHHQLPRCCWRVRGREREREKWLQRQERRRSRTGRLGYCAVRSASHTQQLLSLSPSFAALTVRLTTATSQPISSAEHSSLVAGTAGSSSQSHCHSSSSSSGGKTSDSMYRTFFG